jgi:hypothetical protein
MFDIKIEKKLFNIDFSFEKHELIKFEIIDNAFIGLFFKSSNGEFVLYKRDINTNHSCILNVNEKLSYNVSELSFITKDNKIYLYGIASNIDTKSNVYSGIVIKLDLSLKILNSIYIQNESKDVYLKDIIYDKDNELVCIGYVIEKDSINSFINVYDNDFNRICRKMYVHDKEERFYKIRYDSNDNHYYVVGEQYEVQNNIYQIIRYKFISLSNRT